MGLPDDRTTLDFQRQQQVAEASATGDGRSDSLQEPAESHHSAAEPRAEQDLKRGAWPSKAQAVLEVNLPTLSLAYSPRCSRFGA